MMKHFRAAGLSAALMIAAFAPQQTAQATVPTIDPAVLIENMIGNM